MLPSYWESCSSDARARRKPAAMCSREQHRIAFLLVRRLFGPDSFFFRCEPPIDEFHLAFVERRKPKTGLKSEKVWLSAVGRDEPRITPVSDIASARFAYTRYEIPGQPRISSILHADAIQLPPRSPDKHPVSTNLAILEYRSLCDIARFVTTLETTRC